MPPAQLAELILLLHFGFILFVLFGGLLVIFRRGFAWLHIPMCLWGALVNITELHCPLTPLENHYRQLAGETGYEGGFIQHYIAPLVYPEGLTQDLGLAVGIGTLLWNAGVYTLVLGYRRKRPIH